jgi:hypothetical protein
MGHNKMNVYETTSMVTPIVSGQISVAGEPEVIIEIKSPQDGVRLSMNLAAARSLAKDILTVSNKLALAKTK